MPIPLLDLKAQYAAIRHEIQEAVHRVFESQQFILGPEVSGLEEEVARYCGCRHAVGLTSGTDALLVSLMALGVGPGDEVIVPAYTFFATAGSVYRLGAKPVFVDIKPDSFNIDPSKIEAAITPRTEAIIPVHLYGQAAEMEPILELAKKRKLFVIEDAAQAIGAEYKGRRAGSIGGCGCLSFFPSKNLGGAGDGGMVVTDDKALADKIRILRGHGMEPKYYHKLVGGNFRLDALQAAILRVKLKHLDSWCESRQRNAGIYRDALAGLPVKLPAILPERRHVFNQFIIRVPAAKRDPLMAHLKADNIGCEIYYPLPLHLQECFASLGGKSGDFPVSEAAARETIALPIYPELTIGQIREVAAAIGKFLVLLVADPIQ